MSPSEHDTAQSMRAYRLLAWGEPPRFVTVPVPAAQPGAVVVEVSAVGLCHSDLHVMAAPAGRMRFEPPFTLGHEIAGRVAAVGAGVTGFGVADPVVVHGIWACGRCRKCLAGRENYCADPGSAIGGGLGRDGGLARYVLVPDARHLVPIGAGLDPALAAPLTDAGLTSYHAISRARARLTARSACVVIGVGGLGHLAIQLLRVLSPALIVAVDPQPHARELARRCGAHATVASVEQAQPAARRLVGADGADLVLDFVGAPATVPAAAAMTAQDGDLMIVGGAGGELSIGKHLGLPAGVRYSMPFWGTRAELVEVVSLADRGLLVPEVTVYRATELEAAYQDLRSGVVVGRAVVTMDTRSELK